MLQSAYINKKHWSSKKAVGRKTFSPIKTIDQKLRIFLHDYSSPESLSIKLHAMFCVVYLLLFNAFF